MLHPFLADFFPIFLFGLNRAQLLKAIKMPQSEYLEEVIISGLLL